jgi:hypothetical protein
MSSKRFRIAFSFAGEKRAFVKSVADLLAARFSEAAILYDKFHKAEFSRDDLAFYLPKLYRNETDLVVAVFCPDYHNKEWCGLEWKAIFDLLKTGHSKEVMLPVSAMWKAKAYSPLQVTATCSTKPRNQRLPSFSNASL